MVDKEQVFISFIVYCNNITDVALKQVKQYHAFLREYFTEYELLLVNDSSQDISTAISPMVEKNNAHITIINTAPDTGVELSLKAGIDFCIGDIVFTINSLEYNIEKDDFFKCYYEIANGFDIITLSPKDIRKSSKLFYHLINQAGMDHKIYTEIATIITRRAINVLNKANYSTLYRKALYGNLGYKHKWIFVDIQHISEEGFINKINNAFDYALTYSKIGTQLSLCICLFCLIVSCFLGVYSLITKFTYDDIESGWTTIMLFLSLGFSGIFAILTVLCKYLEILIKNTLLKSQYKISSIDNYS